MDIPEYFISCDWGTSNFRLRVVKAISLEIIKEVKTNQGVKVLYGQYVAQKKLSQLDFFSNYLISQIQILPVEHQNHLIVSSGMVSSSIGLCELDYANIPLDGTGKNLITKQLQLKNHLKLLLISGVKDANGMMRGEETQAIGLEQHLHPHSEGILLLPGTHSKHLVYKNDGFTELKSFMTGELFEIISQKSILSNSIIKEDKDNIAEAPFLKGVKLGSEGQFSSSLFSIRANDLFGKSTKADNYFFLSGLLLGDELAYLKNETKKVFLAAPFPLSNLYKMALDYIMGADNYMFFNNETVEKAMLIGQKKIIEYYEQ